MPELAARVPCPVCLGVAMHKVKAGGAGSVEVDLCRRCGGIWLEQGEVQQLRAHPHRTTIVRLDLHAPPQLSQCHNCHAPINRDAGQCSACGHANVLDCPHCNRSMQVLWRGPLRLDICRECRGTWFDRHELEALWGPQFDLALQHRVDRDDKQDFSAGAGADLLVHSVFYGPDLLLLGGSVAADVASATVSVMAQLPEAISASPEAAATFFEVIVETAELVFEMVFDTVSGIFGS